MLHYDKHEGWQKLCNDCNEGRVEFHTTSYFGGIRNCNECEGAGGFEADLADFDGETVRLHTGETVTVGDGQFWSMDGDPLRDGDVDDIAAVLESELA
jgi:hypothetical protein